jgi:hypothetical protein
MDVAVTRQSQQAAPAANLPKVLWGGIMKKLRLMVSFLALVLAASLASSCGASSSNKPAPTGQLQSITLSPATADAQEAQFIATGHYINPPATFTPQPAYWGACQQNAPTSDVSVTPKGLAQCASGAAGTYTVFAFVGTNCNVITACGGGCTIVGTAQLTCP